VQGKINPVLWGDRHKKQQSKSKFVVTTSVVPPKCKGKSIQFCGAIATKNSNQNPSL
jgi:hypothetical protein